MRPARLTLALAAGGLAAGLGPAGPVGAPPARAADQALLVRIPLGLIEPDIPKDDALTVPKVRLGERLFFDARLSSDGKVSCATCHDPAHAFAEARPLSVGAEQRVQRRNAPSVLNVGLLSVVGWDGRFHTLEKQALEPFHTWSDMGRELDAALDVVDGDAEYPGLFRAAFGRPPSGSTLARALAAYERSLVSGDSRFDQYLYGGREDALSALEQAGFEVFIRRANCLNCHDVFHPVTNPLGARLATFTDQRHHNLGVGYDGHRMADVGRYQVTRRREDWGAFRTPSLRNVALTAPYMHDGSLRTLEEVVDFYDRGGTPNPNLAPGMRPLYLDAPQRAALVAFLKALTDPAMDRAARAAPAPP